MKLKTKAKNIRTRGNFIRHSHYVHTRFLYLEKKYSFTFEDSKDINLLQQNSLMITLLVCSIFEHKRLRT